MAPGVLAQDGFLGHDQRSLQEIVAEDLAELAAAEVSLAELGEFLDRIHQTADAGLETTCPMCDGALSVRLAEGMGRIPCPFACGFRAHKGIVHVQAGSLSHRLTPLQIHLIKEHGFFQGRGAPFRLSPRQLAELYRKCGS